jgi:hypothetical protein
MPVVRGGLALTAPSPASSLWFPTMSQKVGKPGQAVFILIL